MSKEPFEEHIQDLPWRTPSKGLKDRILASAPEVEPIDSPPRAHFLFRAPMAWAAAVAVGAATLAYVTVRTPPTSTLPPTVVVQTSLEHGLFDMTPRSEGAWSGPLTLTVYPSEDAK